MSSCLSSSCIWLKNCSTRGNTWLICTRLLDTQFCSHSPNCRLRQRRKFLSRIIESSNTVQSPPNDPLCPSPLRSSSQDCRFGGLGPCDHPFPWLNTLPSARTTPRMRTSRSNIRVIVRQKNFQGPSWGSFWSQCAAGNATSMRQCTRSLKVLVTC